MPFIESPAFRNEDFQNGKLQEFLLQSGHCKFRFMFLFILYLLYILVGCEMAVIYLDQRKKSNEILASASKGIYFTTAVNSQNYHFKLNLLFVG